MEKLFVYYSLSGNGDAVAEEFAKHGYKTVKVEETKKMPKSTFGCIMKGGFLAGIGYKSKIHDIGVNFDEYEKIVVGSPIWNARVSCPINTVIDMLKDRRDGVDFVFYSGSGNAEKAITKLKEKFTDAKFLSLKQPRDDRGQTAEAVNGFAGEARSDV